MADHEPITLTPLPLGLKIIIIVSVFPTLFSILTNVSFWLKGDRSFNFLNMLPGMLTILAGVMLWKLMRLGWVLTFALALAGVLTALLTAPSMMHLADTVERQMESTMTRNLFVERQDVLRKMKPEFQQQELAKINRAHRSTNAITGGVRTCIYFSLFLVTCYHAWVIWYLNRQKIRELLVNA